MPMSIETYQALGLDTQPPLEMNGRGAADFRLALNHPGDAPYHPCAEAYPADDVPAGQVAIHRGWSAKTFFPGATRDVFVHIPANLPPGASAQLLICSDGAGYLSRRGPVRAGQVLDTLCHRGEIAPTIGLFVNPGSLLDGGAPDPEQRRREYDALTPAYGRMLVEELEPFVEREHGLRITDDPAGRAVCGLSSGGIAAFTAAWFHPDRFGAVISHCGSFVNIDGGHNWPFLVRSTPRKRLRVFLQGGENDGRNVYGDWPLANRTMAAALDFAGYDLRFEFGTGGHTLRHGGALFADTLRWVFRKG